MIDPKGTDFERYRGATLLTPNMSEFEAVVGKCDSEEEIIEKGLKLISDIELTALLVTRSEKRHDITSTKSRAIPFTNACKRSV